MVCVGCILRAWSVVLRCWGDAIAGWDVEIVVT
jgi:hypothetical protein